MEICGFTFVRNGVKLGYPFEASLRSLMGLCDRVVVNVGKSDDETLDRVRALDDGRLEIFESEWDENLRRGGRILALQTDLALQRTRGDWLVYLQADEVLHEEDYAAVREAMARADRRDDVDGLLFDYLHFYGSYWTVGVSRRWYRAEVRAFKAGRRVRSWRDAQGFRIAPGEGDSRWRKLRVLASGARVFHYGWARPPETMLRKTRHFERLYRSDAEVEQMLRARSDGERYLYEDDEPVVEFRGTHPAVMRDAVAGQSWHFERRPRTLRLRHLRRDLLDLAERLSGHRFFEYRNYILVR